MSRALVLLCVAALVWGRASGVSAQAQARSEYGYPPPMFDPPPPSGVAAMAVGIGGLGLGAEQLLTIPLCYADFYPIDERACLITSLSIAGVGLAVGAASLAIGLRRRARYKAWRKQHLPAPQLGWFGDPHGAGLRYAVRF